MVLFRVAAKGWINVQIMLAIFCYFLLSFVNLCVSDLCPYDVVIVVEHKTSSRWCEAQLAGVTWQTEAEIPGSLPDTLAYGF